VIVDDCSGKGCQWEGARMSRVEMCQKMEQGGCLMESEVKKRKCAVEFKKVAAT
jgi:hypothetical protein